MIELVFSRDGCQEGWEGGLHVSEEKGGYQERAKKKERGGLIHLYALWLDKLQNWICRTVGPSLAASLELLTHI